VPAAIRAMSIVPIGTAVGCPWQNGVVERWFGSCRRELLDHVIAINESHLKRLLASYVDYYQHDRTHCGLQKQSCGSGSGQKPSHAAGARAFSLAPMIYKPQHETGDLRQAPGVGLAAKMRGEPKRKNQKPL